MTISCYITQTGVYIYLQITCEINKTLLTQYFMALFITLGLISRPSAKMLSLAQHPDYAQHLSVYAVSYSVLTVFFINKLIFIRTVFFINKLIFILTVFFINKLILLTGFFINKLILLTVFFISKLILLTGFFINNTVR